MPAKQWLTLPVDDADLALCPDWLDADEADALLQALLETVPWENHRIRIFGREVASPRLSCWIGDPGARYIYSGSRFEPRPWTPVLDELRARVSQACGVTFNSVLANLYRNGEDAMGWHSDDEPELGERPVIASLSVGAVRRFRIRRVSARSGRRVRSASQAIVLGHGSLLRMAGETQRHYQHALPRTRTVTQPRINLTFRHIVARP